jgi:uncharacterized sodium:solute symporter family permease YidK
MFAAVLSALVSSITSFFNSSSTIFTLDIYKQLRRSAKERELMIVGRLYIIFLVALTMAWMPILEVAQGTRFWDYTQNIYAHIIPPIVVIFVVGIFWKRGTEQVGMKHQLSCLPYLIILWCVHFKGKLSKNDLHWESIDRPIPSDLHVLVRC